MCVRACACSCLICFLPPQVIVWLAIKVPVCPLCHRLRRHQLLFFFWVFLCWTAPNGRACQKGDSGAPIRNPARWTQLCCAWTITGYENVAAKIGKYTITEDENVKSKTKYIFYTSWKCIEIITRRCVTRIMKCCATKFSPLFFFFFLLSLIFDSNLNQIQYLL